MENKKKKTTKKAVKKTVKKKGFTLVELLAVIIILAIVVGITIPAVLTTTSKAKQKAFKTAAQAMADWVDKQYQVYTQIGSGLSLATLDPAFEEQCMGSIVDGSIKKYCYNERSTATSGTDRPYAILVRESFISAAGLDPKNIVADTSTSSTHAHGWYSYTQPLTSTTTSWIKEDITRVYINAKTGKSCVVLVAKADGDYPEGAVACGGVCQSTEQAQDYCKEKNMS